MIMLFMCDYFVVEFVGVDVEVQVGWLLFEFGVFWCGYCQVVQFVFQVFVDVYDLVYWKIEDGKGKLLGCVFKVKLWFIVVLLYDGQEVVCVVRLVDSVDFVILQGVLLD